MRAVAFVAFCAVEVCNTALLLHQGLTVQHVGNQSAANDADKAAKHFFPSGGKQGSELHILCFLFLLLSTTGM